MLQEVMRSLLEAYFEPQFCPSSHGFRPGLGCHSALKSIGFWTGTKWFIEGDIKGCFDNIDHTILMSILREKILDGRFLNLVERLLKAGYLEQWRYNNTLSGTPQGGIISPLLANIYLDRLDKFVEGTLIPEFNVCERRKIRPEWRRITAEIGKLKKAGADWEARKPLLQERKRIASLDQLDPEYRRLRYVRYADDFLLAFAGPREEAEDIKARIGDFLRDHLKLEMSPEKTLITHARSEKARFLGYEIGVGGNSRTSDNIDLRIPIQKLEEKIAKYMRDGKPYHRPEMVHSTDFSIVQLYGSEYQGFVEYYAFAKNRFWLNRLRWAMELSMLKTLANKHRSSVRKMYRKYKSTSTRGKALKCMVAKHERPGKEPLVARFGGISLKTQPSATFVDRAIDQDRWANTRSELVQRLMANTCELCGSTKDVEVHHIRKMADLKTNDRTELPLWKQRMSAYRRKTLMVCHHCHKNIHAGNPTRTTHAAGGVKGDE